MKWIEQTDDSTCGQIAVAVIAGVKVEEVVAVVGHTKRTKTKELVAALRHFGFTCPDRCRKMPQPELALAQVHDTWHPKRSGWHWVVVDGYRILDGAFGKPSGTSTPSRWERGWRITSYLPVERL